MGPVPPSRGRLLTGLGVAWVAMSSAAIAIVYAAPVPPLWIAAARTAITASVWVVLGVRVLGESFRALRGSPASFGALVLAGALLALHFALWITSVSATSVAHATVLVALQPLFAGLFGRFLGDRASWRLYAGIGLALVGTALLTGGASASEGHGATVLGDLLAVLAAAASAAYLIAGRRVGERVPLAGAMAYVNGLASVLLLTAALWLAPGTVGPSPVGPGAIEAQQWVAVLWLGLVPGLVGHGLMNWSARYLPVHTVSIAVLLEPAGATLLAYLLLEQVVGPTELAGGALLVFSAWLGFERPHGDGVPEEPEALPPGAS